MFFYDLIIRPIEILLEIIFTVMYEFLGNAGWAIIFVGISVSLLTLPIYLKADKIQEEEIQKQKSLQMWVKHIKNAFRGEERFMMLSTFYRENDYHPMSSAKSLLPLLLQIPFFIAAYHFLSNLNLIQGTTFGIIADLGQPDDIIKVGNLQIHFLPVLMTMLNVFSGFIYTRGSGIREKLQVYFPAVIFLFLLYDCPSGLVLYWTVNNLFSLLKNLVTKCIPESINIKKYLLLLVTIFVSMYYVLSGHMMGAVQRRDREELAVVFLIVAALLWSVIREFYKKEKGVLPVMNKRAYPIQPVIALILFAGMVIPLRVISSAPQDFVNIFRYRSPLMYVLTTTLTCIGFFGVWGSILYIMLSEKGKVWYEYLLYGFIPVVMVNFFFVNADMGTCDMRLRFAKELHLASLIRYGNLVINILVFFIFIILYYKKKNILKMIINGIIVSFIAVSAIDIYKSVQQIQQVHAGEEHVEFALSRTEKNVVVIMLDRAIGAYIPFIMEERPDLMEKMDGFTFYPNVVTTAYSTRCGSQAIFGGYDYLGDRMLSAYVQDRDEWTTLTDEALTVMPYLFGENDYRVSIGDVPCAGGQEGVSDYSIYDDYDYVNAFHYGGRFKETEEYHWEDEWRTIERNFVMYSFLRMVPAEFQDNVYDGGRYMYPELSTDVRIGEYKEEYRALVNLKSYTTIDDGKPGLIMYTNLLSHEPNWLQLPDYELTDKVDNSGYDIEIQRELNGIRMDLSQDAGNGDDFGVKSYFVNVAALLRLAEWFDYLRENGVYDNTRIILVSDHGYWLGQFDNLRALDGKDMQTYNCLLMVKDYNSKGFTVDNSFMTNADVPSLAMDGIISNPVNPYTDHPISTEGKKNGVDIVSLEGDWDDPLFYHVKNDIFRPENWSYADPEMDE